MFILIKITSKQTLIETLYTNIKMEHPHKYQYKPSCPVTLNNSNEVSFEQPCRKYSMASLSNQIDIEKVMVDIKLTPLKSNEFQQKIKTIYSCLQYLKRVSPCLLEQIRTAQLVIQSIQSKFVKQYTQTKKNSELTNQITRPNAHRSIQKMSQIKKQHESQVLLSKRKGNFNFLHGQSQVSPIKQLDQLTSRIVYTNFSLKDLQSSCKQQQNSNKRSSIASLNKRSQRQHINKSRSQKQIINQSLQRQRQSTNKKQIGLFTVSKFDPQDQEMQRLTKNIQALDKVLQQKGLGLKNSDFKHKNDKVPLKQSVQNTQKKSIFKSDKKQMLGICGNRSKSFANKQNLC